MASVSVYRCKACGAAIELVEGAQVAECGICGTRQNLKPSEKKIGRKPSPILATDAKSSVENEAVSQGVTVESLTTRIFLFLEDGKWENADSYCERVLDIDPKNAQAYLGKMLAQLQVRTPEKLGALSESFTDNENYSKIMRFGDEELKAEMSGYLAEIAEREAERAKMRRDAEEHVATFEGYETETTEEPEAVCVPEEAPSVDEKNVAEILDETDETAEKNLTKTDGDSPPEPVPENVPDTVENAPKQKQKNSNKTLYIELFVIFALATALAIWLNTDRMTGKKIEQSPKDYVYIEFFDGVAEITRVYKAAIVDGDLNPLYDQEYDYGELNVGKIFGDEKSYVAIYDEENNGNVRYIIEFYGYDSNTCLTLPDGSIQEYNGKIIYDRESSDHDLKIVSAAEYYDYSKYDIVYIIYDAADNGKYYSTTDGNGKVHFMYEAATGYLLYDQAHASTERYINILDLRIDLEYYYEDRDGKEIYDWYVADYDPDGDWQMTYDDDEEETFEYTVREGDNLYNIAGAYGTTFDELCEINDLENGYNIKVGQILKVPVDRE